MDLGQIILLIGIIGIIDSLIAMSFPELASKFCRAIGFKKFCSTGKRVKKIAIREFVIALILCLIGMNI